MSEFGKAIKGVVFEYFFQTISLGYSATVPGVNHELGFRGCQFSSFM